MPIILNCPGCGKYYELDAKLAGKRARCKQCGLVFPIPAEEPVILKTAPPRAPLAEVDDVPSPARPGVRLARARRKAPVGLPPLVKAGLILIGTIVFGGSALTAAIVVTSGRRELVGPTLTMIGLIDVFVAFVGLSAVC